MTGRLMWIFLDGKYKQVPIGTFQQEAPGLVSRRGAFESMVLVDGVIESAQAHDVRLRRALLLMKISWPTGFDQWHKIALQVAACNDWGRARLRLAVWREDAQVHWTLMAQPLRLPSKVQYAVGWRLGLSSFERNPGYLSSVKTFDYQVFTFARKEAVAQGLDEGVLLNRHGDVVEAAYANLFCVKDDVVFTPPVSSGCLNGITRQIVLRLAVASGFKTRVVTLNPEDLSKADEIFLTNSVIGIMPCSSLDSQQIGIGRPGKITNILRSAYLCFKPNA